MKVMLQNSETGLLYAGRNSWTAETVKALDFHSVTNAVEAYKSERLAFAAIFVQEGPFASPFSLPERMPSVESST